MKIIENKGVGITGKDVSLSIAELIVLADVASALSKLDLDVHTLSTDRFKAKRKEEGHSYANTEEERKDVLIAAKKAGIFIAKMMEGVQGLKDAEKELFTFDVPDDVEKVIEQQS
jgi:hypothetical protein